MMLLLLRRLVHWLLFYSTRERESAGGCDMRTLSTDEISSLVYGVESDTTYPIQLAVQAGQEVWRVIHGMKQVVPSRFGTNDDDDWTGWVWLAGKRTPVETAYWGDVLIWRLSDEAESEGE